MAQSFTQVPVLNFDLIKSAETRIEFLKELRRALVVVGFFYVRNIEPWLPRDVRLRFVQNAKAVCNMPAEEKQKMAMINSKHFLGYSQMGGERTARKVDYRDMFDFLSPVPAPTASDPVYMNVQGPNQWPDEDVVPGFRQSLEDYLAAIERLGGEMKVLVAEALGLEATALHKFFPQPPRNKISLLKYPEPWNIPGGQFSNLDHSDYQGVGPHKDGGILTYLLQATPHPGLEAQNAAGQWIPIPPIEDTLVVNVGRSLEAMTRGVCTATMHRVNLATANFFGSPNQSLGPRFSFPVFQTLKLDLSSAELQSLEIPESVKRMLPDRKHELKAEEYFAQYHLQCPGMGIFMARLTSHPDVARRWYPEIAAQALDGQARFSDNWACQQVREKAALREQINA